MIDQDQTTRWIREDSGLWRLITDADGDHRRCRYLAAGRAPCGRPAVAALNRGKANVQTGTMEASWWWYCGDHLYGRRVVAVLELQKPDRSAVA